ncbi:hypothetical protein [Desulfallas thermosapovorans]|uniref:Uncharacterized protein n=1 Tax=Desulfallas thermosapovorans DSM 6562 TaxID=1121431 RepID=A0A5S4ZP75_9FIRM|nr:hypothetical protein [Desulfallas thermosapovorans]TYO93953.1 hypothetical protein LX24_02518 [Desulfallas thermosapovorans DSM 6562]
MFCQLDQVKQVLDITSAVNDALRKKWDHPFDMAAYSLRAATVIWGLLVLDDYDVFMKQGAGQYWVELYIDGAIFIIMAIQPEKPGQGLPDIVFIPGEDALVECGLSGGADYEWRRDDCEEYFWQAVLDILNRDKNVCDILDEIENSW